MAVHSEVLSESRVARGSDELAVANRLLKLVLSRLEREV
jgi:hypothetical protein